MTLRPVFRALGLLMMALASTMLIPAVINATYVNFGWEPFLSSACITGVLGLMVSLSASDSQPAVLGLREAFLLTVLSWITICVFAALPFIVSGTLLSWTDALFESVSALTTTGASVIDKLERVPAGILLWRSLLQWLGGIGIVVMAMTVLPILKIGGMQLYRTESSDRSEKILPRASQIAASILSVQAVLTACSAIVLVMAGMGAFDAVCHALSAFATGGFSTHDTSVAYFHSVSVELVLMVSMILGSCPLLIFIKAWQGNTDALWKDQQVRAFLGVIAVATLAVALWSWSTLAQPWLTCLRTAAFFVVSTVTSSGFVSSDVGSAGSFPMMMAFLLMSIGGCTGSTAGGIKILRLRVLYAMTKAQIAQLRRPHGVFLPHYEGRPIDEGVSSSVTIFVVLYGLSIATVALLLSLFDLPFSTALSIGMASVANAGINPDTLSTGLTTSAHTLGHLPSGAKWIMMVGMLIGRLEMLTVLVLFVPSFWRR